MNRNTSLLIATVLLASCILSCSASRPWRAPPGPVWTWQDRQDDELQLHGAHGRIKRLVTRRRSLGQRQPVKPPSPDPNRWKTTVAPVPPPPAY